MTNPPDRINIEWSKPQLGRDTPPSGLLACVMVVLIVMHLALRLEFLRGSQIGKARCVAIEMKPHTAGLSVPVLRDDRRFKVLITSAKKGSIPAHIWRSAHVVFMDDL